MVVPAHGVSALVLVARTVLSRINPEEIDDARSVFQTGIRAFTAAGWLGVIIGVVQMLTHLDDPSQLGPATAVALLTAFYGHVFAYVVCMPLERSLSCHKISQLHG
jgi:chemotaxis protein MotA